MSLFSHHCRYSMDHFNQNIIDYSFFPDFLPFIYRKFSSIISLIRCIQSLPVFKNLLVIFWISQNDPNVLSFFKCFLFLYIFVVIYGKIIWLYLFNRCWSFEFQQLFIFKSFKILFYGFPLLITSSSCFMNRMFLNLSERLF